MAHTLGHIDSMSSFGLFARLPTELRSIIWTIEASRRRVIAIGLEGQEIRYAEPHPLLHVCKESRLICLSPKLNPDRLQLRRREKNETQAFATNFAYHFFFIRTIVGEVIVLPEALRNMKRLVIPNHTTFSTFDRLDVEELWVLVERKPEQFHPAPASEFRRHCYLHHCEEFPVEFRSVTQRPRPLPHEERKKDCPACLWRIELGIPPNRPARLTATLDSLPTFPTVEQISLSRNSVVRWVSRELGDHANHDRLEDMVPGNGFNSGDGSDDNNPGAVACLLEGSSICIH